MADHVKTNCRLIFQMRQRHTCARILKRNVRLEENSFPYLCPSIGVHYFKLFHSMYYKATRSTKRGIAFVKRRTRAFAHLASGLTDS